jgi:hypothetical protein
MLCASGNRRGRFDVSLGSPPSSNRNDEVIFRSAQATAIDIAGLVSGGFIAQAAAAPTPPAVIQADARILEAHAGWVVEQIPIPLGFAPSQAVSQLGDSLQAPAAVFVRGGEHYRGRLGTYDAFATNTRIFLNARVQSRERGGKLLIVFEMPPQGLEHEVWRQLASIRVRGPGGIKAAAGR